MIILFVASRYFGGGTVSGVVADENFVRRPESLVQDGLVHSVLEDGTLNYHSVAGDGS